ncbi:MAG: hypothetical protein FJY75_05655 [Candidatus Eisenbacteria bacterium]|uniref:DUF4920 domain-containing protein n=1 Tax=Eiseniibacteriota bacterium TaxID=2212470 RepID=A0A937X7J2_UNCEI|nr:hypothetical protein [Candidatus Eisenbacteria bacterium]
MRHRIRALAAAALAATVALTATAALAALAASGCARKVETFGAPLSPGPAIAIADIFSDPGAHEGRTVKLEGTIETECPAGCWLNVADPTGVLFVELSAAGIALPQRVGRKVAVEGVVVAEKGRPVSIRGRGVEIR